MTKEKAAEMVSRRLTLLAMVSDAYWRMATNTSMIYRTEQLAKCQEWLSELTQLHTTDPVLFHKTPEQLFL